MESKVITKQVLWMELDEWTYKSCIAHFGEYWFCYTLYDIESKEQRQWHATQLLKDAIEYYEKGWFLVAWTVALNEAMRNLYKKVGISMTSL